MKLNVVQHEDEEIRYSEVEKANTQFNVISPIKHIMCTSMGEGGETLLTLEEYNEKYSHISLRKL